MTEAWGYGKFKGPETWGGSFDAANGQKQSPINIIPCDCQFSENLNTNPLRITMDKTKMENQILNTSGHNFKVDTPDGPSTVSGGPTNDVYKLVQYHFHWGQTDDSQGSEHLINGKYWPSELHLVHYNSTKYESVSDAVDKPDGLLVLGVFLQVDNNPNPEIEKLIGPLSVVRSFKTVDLNEENITIDLKYLIPKDTSRYYTYPGSLTTPPCYESVTWVVFEQPITIGSDQLLQFRWIHMGDPCGTQENCRPVNPLNERLVSKSFE